MIKKLFTALVVVLFATSVMAQSGLTCDDPIPVDENYRGRVEGPCTVWYSAWTYDLPLTVYFSPDAADSQWGPDVEVDFTCTPGKYEDPKLHEVITTVTDLGFSLPVEFLCDRVFRNGKYAYDLNIGKFYRDQLAESGITYNVQAFVKVTFYEAGEISLRPDTLFKNCIENSHRILLGDTIDIAANDSSSVFIVSFPDWKKDSTRIVWDGEQPAQIWLATNTCEFAPKQENVYVYTHYTVAKDAPYKLYKEQMEADIENSTDGGIFYAKILSSAPGRLVVEKIPVEGPKGGATLLEYDKSVKANASQMFAITKTWRKATQFIFDGVSDVEMQVSNSHLFDTSVSNVFVETFSSSLHNEGNAVSFTSAELITLVDKILDNYLYIRFVSKGDFTLTPKLWNVSECVDKTQILYPNQTIIARKGGNPIYRLPYSEFENCDVTINWEGSSRIYIYFGDTCTYAMSKTNEHVFNYIYLGSDGTYDISAETIDTWKDFVDGDGYVYVRFNPNSAGYMTLDAVKPAPSSPCVLGSTELKLNSVVNLNLASVHTIYRINYAEWQAAGATLAWEGTSPLHTFLASTCTFPVAPHNRYVLDYEAVLPAGEKVMAADWLARMAQYVDEDGYLYIRFLTEFEGTLRVK